MLFIAWRNLFQDRFRFFISILGVAFSVLLILVLLGLFRGWKEKFVSYVGVIPADVWILQEGADDFFNSISILPESLREQILEVDNVESVDPLVGRIVSFDHRDEKIRLFVLGYDTNTEIGGPPNIIEGKEIPEKGEIIIDRVFAKTRKVVVGDKITILGEDFSIRGVSEGGDFVFYQLGFMQLNEAQSLINARSVVNFYIVSFEDPLKLEETIGALYQSIDGINVITKPQFIVNNQKDINDAFIPVLSVLVFLGFLVGITIVGQIIYTTTIERSKEYGILKAIGASNAVLYKTIFYQSFTICLLGYISGIVLTFFTVFILNKYVPQFVTAFWQQDIVLTFFLVLVMGLLSGYLPARRTASIDPAVVFKA